MKKKPYKIGFRCHLDEDLGSLNSPWRRLEIKADDSRTPSMAICQSSEIVMHKTKGYVVIWQRPQFNTQGRTEINRDQMVAFIDMLSEAFVLFDFLDFHTDFQVVESHFVNKYRAKKTTRAKKK